MSKLGAFVSLLAAAGIYFGSGLAQWSKTATPADLEPAVRRCVAAAEQVVRSDPVGSAHRSAGELLCALGEGRTSH